MSTHDNVSNVPYTSSLSEDSEFSDSVSDKSKGIRKRTHLYTSKRCINTVDVATAQEDGVDNFIIPPSISTKSYTKGGGSKKSLCEEG
jgi:hypothetical protein